MYYAYVKYTAVKDQTQFTFSFPLTEQGELKVAVNGTQQTSGVDFNADNGVVTFTTPMLGGEVVEIRRETSLSSRKVNFSNTAWLTEEQLDNSAIQLFHALQEQSDRLKLLGG